MKYNIGKVRRFFLMPFSCKYNAWVRDTTAWIERKLAKPIEMEDFLAQCKMNEMVTGEEAR